MVQNVCPHCGVETPAYADGHWRHVRSCSKNPDPACPKCGLHFKPERIAGHIERCKKGSAAPAVTSSVSASAPTGAAPASAGSPATSGGSTASGSGVLQEVPPERRTPTDELVLPLMAPPSEKPEPPAPAKKAKRAPTGRAAARQKEDATSGSAPAPATAQVPQKGVGAAFDQRDPPRTAAFASFGESLKKNWVLLAIIAIGLVLVIVWRKMNRQNEPAPVQQPSAPPPPTTRPPYNPETHGTLEQYRATYGHLPARGGT